MSDKDFLKRFVKTRLKFLAEFALDAIYPPACYLCGELVADADCGVVCADCRKNIRFVTRDGLFAAVYEGAARKTVHALKYGGKTRAAKGMARLWREKRVEAERDGACSALKADIFIPVPMYKGKEKQRGYNQAALFAEELAALYNAEYDGRALERRRDTPAQSGLDEREREKNVKGAFVIADNKATTIAGKVVALCDDVVTTGATARECVRVLMGAGAEAVVLAAFAATEKRGSGVSVY